MNFLYIAFLQALAATFGSLFFSEVMKLPPCTLCWYQRIFMYPLAVIIPIAALRHERNVHQYVLPFSIAGWFVALYHNLLYYNILPQGVVSCARGISCTTRFPGFGIITIPLLSLVAFTVINIFMVLYIRQQKSRH